MTEDNQDQVQQEQKNDKEYNFRALEAKHAQEREQMRQEYEAKLAELQRQQINLHDDDEDDDPYIDKKKLAKQMQKFEQKLEEKFSKKSQETARSLLQKEKEESWIKGHPDFYQTLQQAEQFAKENPDLAEDILEMPESFARQKLVYHNIKKLQKKEEAKESIQNKIDQNRRSPYYQPSGTSTSPYGMDGDFSPTGQQQAYQKLLELKKNLRI